MVITSSSKEQNNDNNDEHSISNLISVHFLGLRKESHVPTLQNCVKLDRIGASAAFLGLEDTKESNEAELLAMKEVLGDLQYRFLRFIDDRGKFIHPL